MIASESCSTSSSTSGDDFCSHFLLRKVTKSLHRIYNNNRSTVDETDTAVTEAQSGENESDPDLDLCPSASRVGNTFWCQCGEGVVRHASKTGLRLLFWLCRMWGESVLSAEGLHINLQLSRTTCHYLQAFSFTYVFFFGGGGGMTKRPLKCLTQQQVSGNFLVFATALLRSIDGSFIHHCLYLFFNFSEFSGSEWSRRAATKHTSSKFLVPRKLMKAHATLSVFVVLAVAKSATEDRFQRRRPTRLTLSTHAVRSVVTSRRSKALERSGQKSSWEDRPGERTCSCSLPHVRNSESRFTSTHVLLSRLLCDRRPTSASGKGSLRTNVWYASYKQSTHWWTASRGVKKAKF